MSLLWKFCYIRVAVDSVIRFPEKNKRQASVPDSLVDLTELVTHCLSQFR